MKTTAGQLYRICLTSAVIQLSSSITQAALFSPQFPGNSDASNVLETVDWDDYYSEMGELEDTESMLEQWSERVQELIEHPLDLNAATKQDIADLPFMNDKLIEDISYYLYRYGPMKNVAELKLIEGMDEIKYRLLCHLIYLGNIQERDDTPLSLKTIVTRGKQDLRFQMGRPLEKKKGYKPTVSDSKRYMGDAWSSSLRYGFNYKKKLQFGFTAQKDGGEPWLDSRSTPDYLSAHILIKDFDWCKTLVLGDYSLTLGQGLICGQSFLVGKGSFTGNPGSVGSPLKRHASCGESTFFRGMAFDIDLFNRLDTDKKGMDISLLGFYSKQRIDGTIVDNSLSNILSTGLHRTREEREKKNAVSSVSVGASLGINTRWGRINVNYIHWKMDKPLTPTRHPYNQFQLHGSKGYNTSVDYRVLMGPFTCFGEVAVDQNSHCAYQLGIYTTPLSNLSVSLHYRDHGIKYNALHAGAFGENNRANNERGLYASLAWEVIKHLTLSGYVDTYVFPWMTYRCDEPSNGNQRYIQGLLQMSSSSSLLFRYKEKNNKLNKLTSGDKNPWMDETLLRHVRFQLTHGNKGLESRTIVDATYAGNALKSDKTTGYSISQQLKFTPHLLPVQLTAKISCFDIPNYENRVTSFEASLPGSSRFTTLYGEGCRLSLMCTYSMGKSVQWWLDVSRWDYTDRSIVGTGLEEVKGNHLTSIQLMLRLKL